MRPVPYVAAALVMFSCSSGSCSSDPGESSDNDDTGEDPVGNDGPFVVVNNPHEGVPGFREFARYVDVHGLSVYGESGVSDEKMLYVAAVFAELLDNDEDGEWDDQAVAEELVEQSALMPIFSREGSAAERDFFDNYEGEGVSAVLYNTEVDPAQPGHWGSDATVEETMHTINAVGHTAVYPNVFGLEPGSSRLSEAMDVARGGQWTSMPDPYPDEAWYHYDDRTCDYECMAIEYIYWAQVSHMGILDDPATCQGIANEWELCSPDLLHEGDVLISALLIDPAQPLPQQAPDGQYAPSDR
jgi:hypothetical protein